MARKCQPDPREQRDQTQVHLPTNLTIISGQGGRRVAMEERSKVTDWTQASHTPANHLHWVCR